MNKESLGKTSSLSKTWLAFYVRKDAANDIEIKNRMEEHGRKTFLATIFLLNMFFKQQKTLLLLYGITFLHSEGIYS